LTEVISDIAGVSGRRILKAIVAGETNAQKLAALGSSPSYLSSRAVRDFCPVTLLTENQ
jgi:hypothetical protein